MQWYVYQRQTYSTRWLYAWPDFYNLLAHLIPSTKATQQLVQVISLLLDILLSTLTAVRGDDVSLVFGDKQKRSVSNEQFCKLTGVVLSLSGKDVIVGDSNFRTNESADVNATQLNVLIWIQHINLLTHVVGNTLEMVLICNDMSVSSIHTGHSANYDHHGFVFNCSCVSLVLSENLLLTGNGNLLILHLHNLINVELSRNFYDLSSAIGFYWHYWEKNAPKKSRLMTVQGDKPVAFHSLTFPELPQVELQSTLNFNEQSARHTKFVMKKRCEFFLS